MSKHLSENEDEPQQSPLPPSRSPLEPIQDPSQSQSDKVAKALDCIQTKLNGIGIGSGSKGNTPARNRLSIGRPAGRVSMPFSTEEVQLQHFQLLQDPSFSNDHNVQVLIRIRPLSSLEKVSQGYGRCLKQESPKTLVWLGQPQTRFTFDHVACETISQEKLFRVAGLPMVENCMSGYNSCMFAYGQTGSGKTYTMMGELNVECGELNVDCGITPRIFEHLFMRIKEEEENRNSEGLKYSCKCSFLEIYNEQITDLLDPSHNNLQLREDLKKGVYVENLSDYDVRSANDVLNLLREGAANRKIAATRMNNESSRSHSVFTCIIESHWEKDSMNHFRFSRLNLVDLAGSERQKSSGAEGDRLKEAATINRSLSTLGLVIMSLVDLAHGKQRHVPYRDSRLTFLLQDSLGGNSKTTIIANVSPSVCSAGETFSTLKFAQRAKLIQNNAKVNEDASGDVSVLQQQIQQLKGQLNSLMKHQDTIKDSSNSSSTLGKTAWSSDSKRCNSNGEVNASDDDITSSLCDGKVKSLKSLLLGTLRRENLAEMEIRRLQKELDQTNSLVHLHEEDAQHHKMILEIHDKRIKESKLYTDGLLSADEHLLGENKALKEEMRLLRAKMNENPYKTKVELEKMRLTQQLRLNQDFHEQGGRETLLAEVSELRDKLLELLEAEEHCWHLQNVPEKYKDNAVKELDECRDMNARLKWEVDELQRALDKHIVVIQDDMVQTQCTKSGRHEDWKSSIETESGQTLLLEHLDTLRRDNNILARKLHQKEMLEPQPGMESENYHEQGSLVEWKPLDGEDVGIKALQERLDQMCKVVEEALSLNNQYLLAHEPRFSQNHQTELDHNEIQRGTTRTVSDLLEEFIAMQSECRERLHIIEEVNIGLRKTLTDKDHNMRALSAEWERAILELTGFLVDGSKCLRDASRQIVGISSTFPHVNIWIREHIERAVKTCIQKEETILLLQHSLEEAQKTVLYMDEKLNSLKGATIAFAEAKLGESDIIQSDKVIKLDNDVSLDKKGDVTTCTMGITPELDDMHADVDSRIFVEVDKVTAVARQEHLDTENMLNAVSSDMNTCLSVLQSEIDETVSAYKEILLDISNDISKTRMTYSEIRTNDNGLTLYSQGAPLQNSQNFLKHGYQPKLVSYINDQISKTNDRLNDISAGIFKIVNSSYACKDNVVAAHSSNGDCSFSGSDHSVKYYSSKEHFCGSPCSSTEETTGLQLVLSHCQKLDGGEREYNGYRELMWLTNEFRLISVAFSKLGALIDEVFTGKDGHWPTEAVIETEVSSSNNDQPVMPGKGHSLIIPRHRASWMELKAGEQLESENTSLIQHMEQLKNSIDVSVGENRLQQNQVHNTTTGIAKSIAWLEGAFEFMQNDLEELNQASHHDASLIVHTTMPWISSCRVMLEDIYTKALENELIVLFLECHVKEFIRDFTCIDNTLSQLPLLSSPSEMESSEASLISYGNRNMFYCTKGNSYLDQAPATRIFEAEEVGHVCSDPVIKHLELKRELQRKDVLLKGLLFDFRLLQESASYRKDFKDEYEKLINNLSQVQYELWIKTGELNDLMVENQSLKVFLNETDHAFSIAKSDLDLARETSNAMSEQNADLRMLIKELYLKNSETERQLEEQVEVVKNLEEEILRMTSSSEEKLFLLLGNSEDDLKTVAEEREKLIEQLRSLQVKLDMAYAVADENEAVAVESRQASEASKLYAEQKEEEVRILEHSIEELECTINVMEKKVHEMEEEVQRQHMIRETLELEMQALRNRLLMVENLTENLSSESSSVELSKGQNIIRSSKHYDFQSHIRLLEDEKLELNKEVKQCKAYISELILHAEAQASQFQEKYKCLVDMFQDKKMEPLVVTYGGSASEKSEKSISRARGSSSPFRCITNMVQQVNVENHQELSAAKLRIEELEALAVNRQKEVCILKSRLAAAESMTHDVIRDLLGVKLDMTNLANLAEQHQLNKLVGEAQQQKVAFSIQEEAILNLRRQLIQLTEEREKWITEIAERDEDELAAQISVECLKERDQLLTAQNDMLKVDKSNLQRRVAELDDMLKKLFESKDIRSQNQLKVDSVKGGHAGDSNRRPGHLGKQLTRVDVELARCRRYERDSSHLK